MEGNIAGKHSRLSQIRENRESFPPRMFYRIRYVNDLPITIFSSDINMFADDTEFHYCHSNLLTVEHTLQADLENISIWLMVNRLKLNVSKPHCMLIGSRQRTGGSIFI